jgi:phospholipase C
MQIKIRVRNQQVERRLGDLAALLAAWERQSAAVSADTPNTHVWLIDHAVELIYRESAANCRPAALARSRANGFYPALCRALLDADKKAPFNNPLFGKIPTWASHFYDPDSGTNWLGQHTPTAVSDGSLYYQLARESYLSGDVREAGYYLGLSLHYMTDLTQPMHAANFTWFDSWSFGYHTAFEGYARRSRSGFSLPRFYHPILSAAEPEAFLKVVARRTKDRFYSAICPPEWTQSYNPLSCTDALWSQRVGDVMPAILGDAIQMTAQYILMWAESVCLAPPAADWMLRRPAALVRAITRVIQQSPDAITRPG